MNDLPNLESGMYWGSPDVCVEAKLQMVLYGQCYLIVKNGCVVGVKEISDVSIEMDFSDV